MKFLKNLGTYLIAPALSLLLFVLLFQLWEVDLRQPILVYGGDNFFIVFIVKTIINFSWFFSNDAVGWPHFNGTFLMHDFPIHADIFHLLIIKFFSLFSSNPYLVLNCFFISTFALIALTAFVALRSISISVFTASLVAVLYTFSPYHFARGTYHAFLSNYAIIPLLIMVALWIVNGKVQALKSNDKGMLYLAPNRFFLLSILIAIFSVFNGIYYAFYGALIFIFAWFLRGFKEKNFFDRRIFSLLFLLTFITITALLIYIPSLLYWFHNGPNLKAFPRSLYGSEFFALRPVNLLLPVANHYFETFANFKKLFLPFSNDEARASSLGVLGSAGFVFLLLWLLMKIYDGEGSLFQRMVKKNSLKKNEQILINDLAGLNFLSLLFATAGGLVMLVAAFFPLLRSHARFSIFISFFSLILVAIIFDKIIEKKIFGKKFFAQILVLLITVLALFDQVGRVSASSLQSAELKDKFALERNFVARIEQIMPKNSLIFTMPVTFFPEDYYDLLAGYLYSSNLRWSYPAIVGRSSYVWQKEVSELDVKNFISELKKNDFAGLYLDRNIYIIKYGKERLQAFEAQLKSILKAPLITSEDARLIFFRL